MQDLVAQAKFLGAYDAPFFVQFLHVPHKFLDEVNPRQPYQKHFDLLGSGVYGQFCEWSHLFMRWPKSRFFLYVSCFVIWLIHANHLLDQSLITTSFHHDGQVRYQCRIYYDLHRKRLIDPNNRRRFSLRILQRPCQGYYSSSSYCCRTRLPITTLYQHIRSNECGYHISVYYIEIAEIRLIFI